MLYSLYDAGMWLLLLISQLLQLPIHAQWCPLLNNNSTTAATNNTSSSSSSSSVHCGLDFTLSYTVIIILTLILHLGEHKRMRITAVPPTQQQYNRNSQQHHLYLLLHCHNHTAGAASQYGSGSTK
jgi:hypothetical protein